LKNNGCDSPPTLSYKGDILQQQKAVLQIAAWLKGDSGRMAVLRQASQLQLADWCIGAGFVRNLVWDKLHGYSRATPYNDIDIIYFDVQDCSQQRDRMLERQLLQQSKLPWSVKNQARMHFNNGDTPYNSCADAMSYWPEIETAVAAKLNGLGEIEIIAPLDTASLFAGNISINPKRAKPEVFAQRLAQKQWLRQWPKLRVTVAG